MRHPSRTVVLGFISIILIVGSEVVLPSVKVIAQPGRETTFQQFEHGFMLGDNFGVTVYPFEALNGFAYGFSENDISALKENPMANLPPARDYQPTGDFAKLWTNILGIMRGLGWAITPPVQYIAKVGAASGTYINLPVSNFFVKVNQADIVVGTSGSANFTLLNGSILHAGQDVWVLVPDPSAGVITRTCTPQRIQFQPDSYSAIVEGWYGGPGCGEADFLVKAMAQQRMTVFVFDNLRPFNTFNPYHPFIGTVTAPDGTNIQTTRSNEVLFSGILPATGDYTIRLMQDS